MHELFFVRGTTTAIAMVAIFAATGCIHRTVATTLQHPMETGQVQPNRVPHQYANQERSYALPPGTLDDEASMTRMDAEAICFDVMLRQMDDGDGQTWTDLRNWEITLHGEPGDFDIVQPTVQLVQPAAQQYQGQVPQQVQTGTQQVCTEENDAGECRRWETRPIYETRWVPGIVTVVAGGGNICFGNPGAVSLQTTAVELRLHRAGRSVNFEWEFQSIVQSQQPQAAGEGG